MFIGHYGVGFAAKKIDSKPSLGTMFLAAQFLDLLWPFLILTGIERVKIEPGLTASNPLDFTYYPFSHSLLFAIVWALLFGLIYFLFKRNLISSVVLGSLVISHWVLDLIVHIPDLPLTPWTNVKVGFGLWNSIILSVLIEVIFLGAGAYLYMKATKAKNKKGSFGLWGLVIFFLVIYFLNITGPPPPSVQAIGYAGLMQWLIIIWAYWIDRNRIAVTK